MSGLVDWEAAARIAALAAGDEPTPAPPLGLDREAELCAEAVSAYTGLDPGTALPAAEWVSRREWAAINLDSMRVSLAPLEARLSSREGRLPEPLAGASSAAAGALVGAQLGALLGLASRRVLGQLEMPVLDPGRPARLLLVGRNVSAAGSELDGSPEAVRRWILLHEVTHAVHFASVDWLREHLAGLVRDLFERAEPRLSLADLAAAAREVLTSDPRRTLEWLRERDPITLLTPGDARPLLERAQAAMSVIEGFAEHVMDNAAPEMGRETAALRASMERRREQRTPAVRLLAWLLGLEVKLRQYRDGKRFCDSVVADAGMASLNLAWRRPAALPGAGELKDPGGWLVRQRMTTPSARPA